MCMSVVNIEAHRHGHHQLLISPSKGEEASCVLLFYLFQMSGEAIIGYVTMGSGPPALLMFLLWLGVMSLYNVM